ncbi:MAG TPA: hypothetical protein VJB99_02630 [Patescibacteria group bacterium]|nr:hypothetical protein [Patescibacteria group bacterium]
MKKYIAPLILGAILLASGAFYGGMIYAKSKSSIPSGFSGGPGGFPGGAGPTPGRMTGGMRGGGGFTAGEVLSMDDQSVTVKLPDGGSKIIFFSASTEITKSVAGATSDITVGGQIMSTGTTNTDGSITATIIQIRPAMPEQGVVSQ